MRCIVAVMMFLPSAAQAQTLIGLSYGMPEAQAMQVLRSGNFRISEMRSEGTHYRGYWLWAQGREYAIGSVSFCRGSLYHTTIIIPNANDFGGILRQRIQELGQPEVSVASSPMNDGSRVIETIDFLWRARRFQLIMPVRQGDGGSANQMITAPGVRCSP